MVKTAFLLFLILMAFFLISTNLELGLNKVPNSPIAKSKYPRYVTSVPKIS